MRSLELSGQHFTTDIGIFLFLTSHQIIISVYLYPNINERVHLPCTYNPLFTQPWRLTRRHSNLKAGQRTEFLFFPSGREVFEEIFAPPTQEHKPVL